MLKRSSRVMPGFLGTPAGMTTRSQSYNASDSLSAPVALQTWDHNHHNFTLHSRIVDNNSHDHEWDAHLVATCKRRSTDKAPDHRLALNI